MSSIDKPPSRPKTGGAVEAIEGGAILPTSKWDIEVGEVQVIDDDGRGGISLDGRQTLDDDYIPTRQQTMPGGLRASPTVDQLEVAAASSTAASLAQALSARSSSSDAVTAEFSRTGSEASSVALPKRPPLAAARTLNVSPHEAALEMARAHPKAAAADVHATVVEPALSHPALVLANDPDSPTAAAYRVLRYRLLERDGARAVVVAGVDEGVDGAACSVNLALALAESERAKVLLLEANLRAPRIAAMLELNSPSCFYKQLELHREKPVAPWVVAALSPCLHVLAVDGSTFQGPRLINGPALEQAVAQLLLHGYDHLVIDAPAVERRADVNVIQNSAQGVVLVAQRGQTTLRGINQAVDQLSAKRVLGVVLAE